MLDSVYTCMTVKMDRKPELSARNFCEDQGCWGGMVGGEGSWVFLEQDDFSVSNTSSGSFACSLHKSSTDHTDASSICLEQNRVIIIKM